MAANTLNFDAVLDLLDNENNNSDSSGISSDEEEDLNRLLAASDSDSRQVFICFERKDVIMSWSFASSRNFLRHSKSDAVCHTNRARILLLMSVWSSQNIGRALSNT